MTNSYITHNRINRDNLVATSGAAACPMMNGRLTNRRARRHDPAPCHNHGAPAEPSPPCRKYAGKNHKPGTAFLFNFL
jgi:hypothetical protein